jgi:hypothetical protein
VAGEAVERGAAAPEGVAGEAGNGEAVAGGKTKGGAAGGETAAGDATESSAADGAGGGGAMESGAAAGAAGSGAMESGAAACAAAGGAMEGGAAACAAAGGAMEGGTPPSGSGCEGSGPAGGCAAAGVAMLRVGTETVAAGGAAAGAGTATGGTAEASSALGPSGVADRGGAPGRFRAAPLSRPRVSDVTLAAAAGFGACRRSPASRIFSGSTSSSDDASAGDGDVGAEGAPVPPPVRGSLGGSASKGVSTGRSASGYPGPLSLGAAAFMGEVERDLGSIMYECDLRQSRRRSCNGRAIKPTCRLTDRDSPLPES